jgi:SAM-dependent methyltransferase
VGVDIARTAEVASRTDEFYVADLDLGLPDDIGDQFDVVICGDVLEHVRRPESLLPEIRTMLSDRGRVLVSIPNFAHWYPRGRVLLGQFDYDERGILDDDHVRFFTRKSFLKLCRKANWEVVRHRTTGVPLDLISSSGIARMATTVERGARALWPTMFAYQFLFELSPQDPGVWAPDRDPLPRSPHHT